MRAVGLIGAAMSGFGKGTIEENRRAEDHQNKLDLMTAQKSIQMDIERERIALSEEVKNRRAGRIKETVDARLSSAADAGPLSDQMVSRIKADAADEVDGNYGNLYQRDVTTRELEIKNRREDSREKREERLADASVANSGRAASADRRAQETHDLTMKEARAISEGKEKYRAAMASGDVEGAKRIAVMYQFGNGTQVGRYQFREVEAESGRKTIGAFDSTTGEKVFEYGGDNGPAKVKPQQKGGSGQIDFSRYYKQ